MNKIHQIASLFILALSTFLSVSCNKEEGRNHSIELLNEGIIYMEPGCSSADILIKTSPADLLNQDKTTFSLVSEEGSPSSQFEIKSIHDKGSGVWALETAFKYDYLTSGSVYVDIKSGLQGALVGPVTLQRTSITISKLYVNGQEATYDEGTSTFTVILPTVTDFSAVKVRHITEAETVLLDGQTFDNGVTDIDASKDLVLTASTGTYSIEYKLTVRNTGLPVVRIHTPDKKNITSKEEWMEGATMRIENADGTLDYEGPMSIRGRGNSTWNYPKKPYAIKLDKKAKVLGMPKHKRWVLLANWKDRTLMRNAATFWISKKSGLPYTPDGYFVELELNGKHKGNYYLCEQIKIDENRVNITEMDSQETDPEKITGGYLMELDTYFDEPKRFMSPRFGLPYQFKEPDETDLSPQAEAWFKNYISDLEALLKNEERVKNHEYEEYFDVDSSIEYLLVEEVVNNNDFYNNWPSNGPHSCYMYKDRGGKLFTGPVWDFDYHTFVPDYSHMWFGAKKTLYYPALYKDGKYRERMLEIWNARKDEFSKLPEYIDQMADYIRISEEINQKMWPIDNRENGDETMTFQQAVDRMKDGFNKKLKWMDTNLKYLE